MALDIPQPGVHNLENATAAVPVARELGFAPADAAASSRFPGVVRRLQVVGVTGDGIRVVDDYAHNAKATGGHHRRAGRRGACAGRAQGRGRAEG